MRPSSQADAGAIQALLEGITDYAIFMLSRTGHVETWSAVAAHLTQYTKDEIVGRHVSALYPRESITPEACTRNLEDAASQGRREEDGWYVRRDGSRFWANIVVSPLRDDEGRLIGFAAVMRDFTERRHTEEALRQSEQRLRQLIESVKDYAIFTLDPSGHITTWNPGAERIKGYRASEIMGRHFSRFYTEEDLARGKPDRDLEIATAEGRLEDEGWRVRADGSRFWASIVISPMRNSAGQLLGFAKVTGDHTERKHAEEERIRVAQMREAIRVRDEFLSIASHELKTPLTSLQLQLQSLALRGQPQDPKLAAKIARAQRSGNRLADLIETLLDVSRIATGRFSPVPEPVDLEALARDVMETFREPALRARCTLSLSLPASADAPSRDALVGRWDRLRIEQVITNLVGNAMKYAAGTAVEVVLQRDGEDAVLTVDDRGPGIPETSLDRIFGRFERAVSSGNYGGLGLGLYVTREIVDAHHGSIQATNRPGGGARFIVRLPLNPDAGAPPQNAG
jgi:PAS domain S-box-containing protein